MQVSTFVHLHVHTEYSLLDSMVRIPELLAAAKTDAQLAVAITDYNNMFALVKFYQAAVKMGIKPIIGAHVALYDEVYKRYFSVILLCQNAVGYKNLTTIISEAYISPALDMPCVKKVWLTAARLDGLLAILPGADSDVAYALLHDAAHIQQRVTFWQELCPQRVYLEVSRILRPQEEVYIQAAIQAATNYNLPLVATNEVRFLQADDFSAHQARVAINKGVILTGDSDYGYTEQQYFATQASMSTLFADLPNALQNTVEITKRCNFIMQLGQAFLPKFPIPTESKIEQYLQAQAESGLAMRLQQLQILAVQQRTIYHTRLTTELAVINSMGFAGYFLIVADFIQWAKQHKIPVGPGRGSGVGSLVAYALQITDLDPLAYDLLFERFLNPERISMPDFDVDFCMDNRDRVIDYVTKKYGRQSVSQIITFGTMSARAVVRDVGRVLGYPYGFVDKIAKLIPFELGITLGKALQDEPQLQQAYNEEQEVRELLDLAQKLEGLTRNVGKHAGGVVIAPTQLTDFAPLYCEPDSAELVTQFDKDDVELVGLVKFDFLGLRTLTIIDWSMQIINQQRLQQNLPELDINLLSLLDQKTFSLLKACQTTAVFQLESTGIKDLIKRLQPDCFEEIIALVALYRPGPLQSGMVEDFINRKHGHAKVEYLHESLEYILKPTYGIILYQEQVMQIAQVLAGYSLGAADLLRRAMGKKKPEEMAKQRNIFVSGAAKNNIDEELAAHIFDLIEKFSGYGFNKSHAAAYALLSYQTAWLKTNHTAIFMAAVLSADMDNQDKIILMMNECLKCGLTILPPDINQSAHKFTATNNHTIRYGLGAIKGIGLAAINNILSERVHGNFISLFNFCTRIDLRKVNKKALEALVLSGACDNWHNDRAVILASLDVAVRFAEQQQSDLHMGQQNLFASNKHYICKEPAYSNNPVIARQELLKLEKNTIGLYFSSHPLDEYRNFITKMPITHIKNMQSNSNEVQIIAMVTDVRKVKSKQGRRLAFVTIEDLTDKMEFALFETEIDAYEQHLALDAIVYIHGKYIFIPERGSKFKINKILPIQAVLFNKLKHLCIKLKEHDYQKNNNIVKQLYTILKPQAQGKTRLSLRVCCNNANIDIVPSDAWYINIDNTTYAEVCTLLHKDQIEMEY